LLLVVLSSSLHETAVAAPVVGMQTAALQPGGSWGGFDGGVLHQGAMDGPTIGGRRLLNATNATMTTPSVTPSSGGGDAGIIVGGVVIGITAMACIVTVVM